MAREHSKEIKLRFIQAVEAIANDRYPEIREVDIIRSVGMDPTNYYKMRVNEGRYPTLDNCALLCETYSISGNWLLANKGRMKETAKKSDPMESLKIAVRELEMNLKTKRK